MEIEELYNLTNPQQNIFMREQFYNGTAINNLSFTFYIKKNLNDKLCVLAINKIIQNNDGIRIRIKTNSNETMQYIENFNFEDIIIKHSEDKTIEEVESEMEEDAKIPFIFENSKLYKFIIYKLKNGETAIYIKLHHIIADAWATKIIFKQFNEYYKSFENCIENGKKIEKYTEKEINNLFEKINIEHYSYKNFITGEQKYAESKRYEKDKAFWENYVEDYPEAIPFKEIATKKNTISDRYTNSIPFSDEINKFCTENSITPYAFFITVYAFYLFKTQSKRDFSIGTPLLNRQNAKEKDSIGMYVSTVPLKIHISKEKTIMEFIKSLAIELIEILRHGHYPYNNILNYAHSKGNSNVNLFDTIISYQNVRPDLENVDYEFDNFWNFSASQQTSFEIHVTDYNGSGKYFLSLDYNEEFCNQEEIELIFNRMKNIMKYIINHPDANVENIPQLNNAEKKMIETKFNCSDNYNPSKTLNTLFEEQVKRTPNNIALKFKDEELTYAELNKRIDIFANHLLENGISKNIPVCILVERSLDMIISMLAVLRVGAYYITIDPFWPNDRVSYIVENSKSNYIITHRKYTVFHKNSNCICVDDIDYTKKCPHIKKDIKMSDYAYVIYTSGSTGKPKGTMMTNININNLLNSTYKKFHQNSSDVWTLFHTYTFDFSAWEIYGCLTHGGKLVIVPKEITTNPKEFLNLIINEKVTILNQTPAYFYKVIEEDKISNKKIKDLKLIILGGEAVFAEPLKSFKTKYPNINIFNGYGPTETTIFAIMGEITDKDIQNNNIFIGKPLLNYKVLIMNKYLEPLGIGCEGEICIISKSVCKGYFNNPEMTKDRFINTDEGVLYKTGDVGYWDLDGRIKYIGRNDNQVKIRGFRIELEEIEKELLKCEDVTKAVVFPIENTNYTKTLIGFIETKRVNYTNEVLENIKKNLTSYMIPKLYQVEEMPINDNGKIDRKRLLNTINSIKKDIVVPKTSLEKEIYDIICEIKKTDNISIKDDFFQDIGMDSLDIMQLATQLSKYNVEIQRINNNSSIEMLADSIVNNRKDTAYISQLYNIDVIEKKFKYNMDCVFLTGSIGFLGIHILRELIDNQDVKKIYCLIRYKNNTNPTNRLKVALKNYYDDYSDEWLEKIMVIAGDFEKEFLGLDKDEYFAISSNITTVIHCGANVRHFGNYNSFYKTNVIGTENIIKLAYDSNAGLAHISTASVGGFSKREEKKILTEKEININQMFNNHVYMVTKYEAECKVLDALSKGWVNAKIFRLGNIMPRVKDGRFQKNKYDNGFLSRMQTILNTRAIPKSYLNMKIDLSPVDLCAQAIVKLLGITSPRTIYHIVNDNFIKVKKIFKHIELTEVTIEQEIEKIKQLNNPYDAHLLNDLLNPNLIETPVSVRNTIFQLNKAHFKWNSINKNYIEKIFNLLDK